MVTASVEVDKHHGPIIRISHDGKVVSVYLMDETAVITTRDGQYGLEVTGPWHEVRRAMAAIAESA